MGIRPYMLRVVLLSFGVGLTVVSCLMFLVGLSGSGFNDAELRRISKTGSPSNPEKLVWSEWRPNDGSIIPLSSFHPREQPPSLPEFRVGRCKLLFFDFTFYQGRYERDGVKYEFPAFGRRWGVSCQWIWAWVALVAGTCFLVTIRLAKRSRFSSPA